MDKAALVVSLVALGLAAAAFFGSDGGGGGLPGKGIDAYDQSSPEAALKSELRIMVRADIRAQMERSHRRILEVEHDKHAVALSSLDVEKTRTHDGKTCVFFTVEEKGRVKHRARWFQKGKDGHWYGLYVSKYDLPSKSPIRNEIDAWESRRSRKVKTSKSLVDALRPKPDRVSPRATSAAPLEAAPRSAGATDEPAPAVERPERKKRGG